MIRLSPLHATARHAAHHGVARRWYVPTVQPSVVILDSAVDAAVSMATALCERGIPATYAATAREATAAAAITHPTAILIDLAVQAALDQLCEDLRMVAPGARLIALSDWSDPGHFDKAMACGFDHFVIKPAAVDTVLQAVLG